MGTPAQNSTFLVDINYGMTVVWQDNCKNCAGPPNYVDGFYDMHASSTWEKDPTSERSVFFNLMSNGFQFDVTQDLEYFCIDAGSTSPENADANFCYTTAFF